MNNISKSITEINSLIDDYQDKIRFYQDEINKNKLTEIKYNNLKRELAEKSDFYETKISSLTDELDELNDSLVGVKESKVLNSNINSNLVSILKSIIDELGIEKVSDMVNIDEDKIKEYLK